MVCVPTPATAGSKYPKPLSSVKSSGKFGINPFVTPAPV
ncbi:hypothetical protein MCEGE10_02844 [Flavobacteriaceae bacterium]